MEMLTKIYLSSLILLTSGVCEARQGGPFFEEPAAPETTTRVRAETALDRSLKGLSPYVQWAARSQLQNDRKEKREKLEKSLKKKEEDLAYAKEHQKANKSKIARLEKEVEERRSALAAFDAETLENEKKIAELSKDPKVEAQIEKSETQKKAEEVRLATAEAQKKCEQEAFKKLATNPTLDIEVEQAECLNRELAKLEQSKKDKEPELLAPVISEAKPVELVDHSTLAVKADVPENKNCSTSIQEYFSKDSNQAQVQKFLKIQADLTTQRVAWAFLSKAEQDPSIKTVEAAILSLLGERESADLKSAREQFQNAPLSRKSLALVAPHLASILEDQGKADPSKTPFLLASSDVKMLGLIAENEQSASQKEGTVINVLKLVNTSVKGKDLSPASLAKTKKDLEAKIKKLQAELDAAGKGMSAGIAGCASEQDREAFCVGTDGKTPSIEKLLTASDEALEAMYSGLNVRSDKQDAAKFGKVYSRVKFFGETAAQQPASQPERSTASQPQAKKSAPLVQPTPVPGPEHPYSTFDTLSAFVNYLHGRTKTNLPNDETFEMNGCSITLKAHSAGAYQPVEMSGNGGSVKLKVASAAGGHNEVEKSKEQLADAIEKLCPPTGKFAGKKEEAPKPKVFEPTSSISEIFSKIPKQGATVGKCFLSATYGDDGKRFIYVGRTDKAGVETSKDIFNRYEKADLVRFYNSNCRTPTFESYGSYEKVLSLLATGQTVKLHGCTIDVRKHNGKTVVWIDEGYSKYDVSLDAQAEIKTKIENYCGHAPERD